MASLRDRMDDGGGPSIRSEEDLLDFFPESDATRGDRRADTRERFELPGFAARFEVIYREFATR